MGVGEGKEKRGGVKKCGGMCGKVCWGVGEVRKDVGVQGNLTQTDLT